MFALRFCNYEQFRRKDNRKFNIEAVDNQQNKTDIVLKEAQADKNDVFRRI